MNNTLQKFVIATLFGALSLPVFSQTSTEAKAWAALKNGGILLMRHANAPGTGDPPRFKLNDCTTQRNLDDVGRAQARSIGVRFKSEFEHGAK